MRYYVNYRIPSVLESALKFMAVLAYCEMQFLALGLDWGKEIPDPPLICIGANVKAV